MLTSAVVPTPRLGLAWFSVLSLFFFSFLRQARGMTDIVILTTINGTKSFVSELGSRLGHRLFKARLVYVEVMRSRKMTIRPCLSSISAQETG
jgi:hypothetical protein